MSVPTAVAPSQRYWDPPIAFPWVPIGPFLDVSWIPRTWDTRQAVLAHGPVRRLVPHIHAAPADPRAEHGHAARGQVRRACDASPAT